MNNERRLLLKEIITQLDQGAGPLAVCWRSKAWVIPHN